MAFEWYGYCRSFFEFLQGLSVLSRYEVLTFKVKLEKLSYDGILSTPFDIVSPLSSQRVPC